MRRNGRTSISRTWRLRKSLRARGHEVMLFISEKEIDALALSGQSNFRFHKLPTIGLPSPFSPAILGFLRRFNESLSLCRGIYRKFKPHVVLGMGGFTSTAPVLAGKMRGIPTFIHESNAIPGKANRLTARMVRAVLLGIQRMRSIFSQGAHGSNRDADPEGAPAPRSKNARGNGSVCGKICSRSWSWAEARVQAVSIRR